MKWPRKLRKSLTVQVLRLGQYLARNGNERTLVRLRRTLRIFTRTALPLRIMLRRNLRAAGVYSEPAAAAYFERAIDQLVMLAEILQSGPDSRCLGQFQSDDSFRHMEQAYARGNGVICIAPHINGYPLFAGVISRRIPCVIFARRNEDPRKMSITESVVKMGKGELVYPPADANKSQRLQVAVDVLRNGRMMFLTPDTPRKPHEGVPVTIFGRTAYFPTGIFVMSLRTGAPVVPAWWYYKDGIYHTYYSEPMELSRGGNLRRKTESAMQKWAAETDAFLHEHPEMWWNWLDKRWTQILRNGQLTP